MRRTFGEKKLKKKQNAFHGRSMANGQEEHSVEVSQRV
jgi:hypothetical protein